MPERVVQQLPLAELWTASGPLPIARRRDLGRADVVALLQHGRVRFVVADCGRPLDWIGESDCFRFWKEEVKPRLVEPESRARLSDYPGEYCYFASEWDPVEGTPVVLLTMAH